MIQMQQTGNQKTYQTTCAVCVIVRLENPYLREWVEHYKQLGFNNVILYDNNHADEDDVRDVIGDYIESKFVIHVKIPDLKNFQVSIYNHCLTTFGNIFGWIAFFDADEFLTLTKHESIQDYIKSLDKSVDSIAFNWMMYGDNDLVYYEDKPLKERFKSPCDFNMKSTYNFPENDHIKTMVNYKKNNKIRFSSNPHSPVNTSYSVLADGTRKLIPSSPFNHKPIYDPAHIKHYYTKTIDEYYRFKHKRACPDSGNNPYNFDRFFKINRHTPEKDEYVNKLKQENHS